MRIAIVNDLALARAVLRRLVLTDHRNVVAWEAADGEEAVRLALKDRPDVILMDLLMPVLNGAAATRKIMAASPCPILIVTSDVAVNYALVCEAMSAGGLDAVNTPTFAPDGSIKEGDKILQRLTKLEQALARGSNSAIRPQASTTTGSSVRLPALGAAPRLPPLLVLGASTGGPEALVQVLRPLPRDLNAAVVIIQHIAADFAPGLVRWLQSHSALPLQLAKDGDEPRAGQVIVAGTNEHLVLKADLRLAHVAEPRDNPYRPSVDVFLDSLASVGMRRGVAALLTGMGSDGARGLLRLRQLGWTTLAQDQASCVVYGMPRAAAELGAATAIVPLSRLGEHILLELRSLPTM